MSKVAVPYLLAFGVSFFFWFIGNEMGNEFVPKRRQKPHTAFLIRITNLVFGDPRRDCLIKLLGSVLMILVLTSFVFRLPHEQMAMYWRVVAFHGFVLVVTPLLIIRSVIEFLKRRKDGKPSN